MGQRAESSTHQLYRRLARLDRRLRELTLLRGIGIVCCVFATGVAIAVAVDWVGNLGPISRLIGLVLLAVVCGYVFWRSVLMVCVRKATPSELAAVVERTYPRLKERLISSVELNESEFAETETSSLLMREVLTRQTLKQASALDFRRAVPSKPYLKATLWGSCSLCLLLLPLAVAPNTYGLLLSRLFQPWANHATVGNYVFDVEPGDRVVARGSDVAIKATVRRRTAFGHDPDTLWLRYSSTTGESEKRRLEYDETNTVFFTTLPHVARGFDYSVYVGHEHSRVYHIEVVDPPAIRTATLEVTPPAYTGLPAQFLDGVLGDVSVFERSRLAFHLEFNKPVASAEITWLDPTRMDEPVVDATVAEDAAHRFTADPAASRIGHQPEKEVGQTGPVTSALTLAPDGRSATLEMPATIGGLFAFRLTDGAGLQNATEPDRNLVLIHDQPPTLELDGDSERQEARPDDVFPIPVDAKDDLGIGALELHFELFPGGKKAKVLDGPSLGSRSIQHTFRLDLAELGVTHGSAVTYRVRAFDTRPVPGPNEVWSDQRILVITREAAPPGTESLAAHQRALKEELRTIIDDVEKQRGEVTDLQREAKTDLRRHSKFDKDEDISLRTQEGAQMAERLENLADRFAEHPLFANLVPQTQRVAREDLAQIGHDLRDAVDASLPAKTSLLEKSARNLKHAADKLRDIDHDFDQLAQMERDLLELNRLADKTQNLAEDVLALDQRQQELLAAPTPEARQQQEGVLAQSQQQLQQEQQQLTEDLKELLDRRPELVDAARKAQLDALAELSRRALELAEPQDALAEALDQKADQAADQFAPLAEQQAQLARKAEKLAASVEAHRDRSAVRPLDPQQVRDALKALKAGNLQEASEHQQAAADDLARLAEELEKNRQLPDDPQQALQELAQRERALQTDLADANNEASKANPSADAQDGLHHDLREKAARQVGVQAALAQLELPRANREQQKQTVRQAADAVEALLEGDRQHASESAKKTAESLERLAREVGTKMAQSEEAAQEVAQLRKQHENTDRNAARKVAQTAKSLAKEQADARRNTERLAKTPAERTRSQAQRSVTRQQQRIRQGAEQLPADIAPLRRADAVHHAKEAEKALEQGKLTHAAAEQEQAEQALRDVQQQAEAAANQPPTQKPAQKPADTQPQSPTESHSPSQQLAQETSKLAEEQRALENQLNQLLPQQAENARDEAQSETSTTPRASTAPTASQQSTARNASPKQTADHAAAPPEAEGASQQSAEDASQNADAVLARQAELNRAFAQLALDVAAATDPQSHATGQATETVKKGQESMQRTQTGQFARASDSARRASEAARATAHALNANAEPQRQLAQQANELGQQQNQVADDLKQLAQSPGEQQRVQQEHQQRLAKSTSELAERFAQSARQLAAEPLGLERPSQRAEKAQQLTETARQSMRQTAHELQQGDSGRAAQAAEAAAQTLRQAADQARDAATPNDATPTNSPIPPDVGAQVTNAANNLQQAGEQLGQAQNGKQAGQQAGQQSSSTSSQGTQEQPANGEPASQNPSSSRGQPSGQSSKGSASTPRSGGQQQTGTPLTQSAASLQQAAQSLSQAAQQLQLAGPSSSRNSQSSNAAAGSPSSPGGKSGGGAKTSVNLQTLQTQIEKMTGRNWGQLPGHLRTAILQASQKKPNGVYAKLIKQYFQEISKTQASAKDAN